MTSWHEIIDPAIYSARRFTELSASEGTKPLPYLDTKGIPSVGIGFNLRAGTVRTAVFQAMGINAQDPRLAGNAAAQVAEQGYINQLTAAVQATYANDAALQQALNNILIARSIDPLLAGQAYIASRNSFEMQPQEIRTTFDQIIPDYENLVDQWVPGIPTSNERLALVSLAYNNLVGFNVDGSFKSANLRQAILADNRAEAWYQIRYGSNGGQSPSRGIANRRYAESDLFGLYKGPDQNNATPDQAEAISIMRMYTTHRDQIRAYESEFSPLTTIGGVVPSHSNDFNISFSRTRLISDYAQFAGAPVVSGEVLVGSNIGQFDGLPENDLILGEARYNNLHGQGGDDILYGNIVVDDLYGDVGNDVLFGESGNDALSGGVGDDRRRSPQLSESSHGSDSRWARVYGQPIH